MGQTLGVLHTKSSYITAVPLLPYQSEDIRMEKLRMQISALEDKENAFAARFGYGSIEELIKGIREILQQAPNDVAALRQFSSTNLRKHLEQFKSKYGQALKGQKIHLTFVANNKDQAQLDKMFNSSGGSGTIAYTMHGNVHIECEWDTGAIKNIINKMKGTHFQTTKENIDYLRDYVLSTPDTFIDVVEGTARKSMEQYLIETTTNPFSLTKGQVQELEKNNRPLLVEFEQKIKNFIYNDLCAGASGEFKKAVQTVMAQKMPQLTDISFLMGGNSSHNVVGSFGELQTAIMFQYIANKVPNKTLATKISTIIGDVTNGYNQQLHTDIQILEAFGIQVKNYSGTFNSRTNMERTVTVHLHPSEVGALGGGEGIVDYIVNSYFNTSIAKYPEENLNNFFKSHASELLNLDFNPDIPDQVCFYMIGSNFIPGSVILKQAFVEVNLKVNTKISGKDGMSDEEYNEGHWDRPFHKWWRSNSYADLKAGDFSPTGANSIGAWDRYISIATSFTYSALFEGAYSLF